MLFLIFRIRVEKYSIETTRTVLSIMLSSSHTEWSCISHLLHCESISAEKIFFHMVLSTPTSLNLINFFTGCSDIK